MADERISGWLPPVAPGSRPPAAPGPAERPSRPTFTRGGRGTQTWAQPAAPTGTQPAAPASTGTQPAAPASTGNTQALWALVLAVAALALLLISLGTFFLITLPCSIAALVLARRAVSRVEAGQTPDRAGQAAAALWIARIGVIAGVAAAVVFIALLAAGFDFEQFRDDLQRELERRRDRRSDGVRTTLEGLRAVVGR
jgi:hypothetical protein